MAAPDTPAEEPAHDVLAAEEFAVPAPDPELRHDPVVLPDDPSGIPEAHDILAAEEFAMPAPARPSSGARAHALTNGARAGRWGVVVALLALLGVGLLRRRRGT